MRHILLEDALTKSINEVVSDYCTQGLYRQRILITDQQYVLNFSSSDYLSLAEDQRIKKAFQRGFKKYPTGSGGSTVVCGYHAIHHSLEQAFASTLGADAALLFTSGYAANLAIIALIAKINAHLYVDKNCHASLYDGIRLHNAKFSRFLHNNMASLQKKLQSIQEHAVILTEGIFSMSGQMADLTAMRNLQTKLIVDEAHAFGILGERGLGAVAQHQLSQSEVPLRMIPFSKTCAAQGAIVAGQNIWIEALIQAARSNIYSTAISPAIAYGLLETFKLIQEADTRRATLFQLIDYFRKKIQHSPLLWRQSCSPIQQLQLSCPHKALYYAQQLRDKGIFCIAMRPPTISKHDTGLRIILNYQHEPQDIDTLLSQLHDIYQEYG